MAPADAGRQCGRGAIHGCLKISPLEPQAPHSDLEPPSTDEPNNNLQVIAAAGGGRAGLGGARGASKLDRGKAKTH
jgi:hypothetical protein